MRQFILGCIVGGVLMTGMAAVAEKDSLGRPRNSRNMTTSVNDNSN